MVNRRQLPCSSHSFSRETMLLSASSRLISHFSLEVRRASHSFLARASSCKVRALPRSWFFLGTLRSLPSLPLRLASTSKFFGGCFFLAARTVSEDTPNFFAFITSDLFGSM